jgi:Fic family protein
MSVSRRIVRSRKEYDLAYLYTEYDELDLTYFIKYNIACIDDSLKDLFEYINNEKQEQKESRSLVDKNLGINLRQIDILIDFKKEPHKIFTIKEIEIKYNIAYQTARTDLMLLSKKNLINKQIAGKVFVFNLK